LLDEASQIAADLVVVSARRAAPTQARRSETSAAGHPLAQDAH
jgi:hypothetical protein